MWFSKFSGKVEDLWGSTCTLAQSDFHSKHWRSVERHPEHNNKGLSRSHVYLRGVLTLEQLQMFAPRKISANPRCGYGAE